MKAKLPVENIRHMAELARGLGGSEVGVAAQLFVDLLISAEFSSNGLTPEMFATLLKQRLERHRAQFVSTSKLLH